MCLFIGDERGRLAFTAGSGGRRNSDEGEHRFARFSDPPVILHAPSVRQEEIATLRSVHRTATAQADQRINTCLAGNSKARFDTTSCRVFAHLLKYRKFELRSR